MTPTPDLTLITRLADKNKRTCLLTGDTAEEEILHGLVAAERIADGRIWTNVLKGDGHRSAYNLSRTLAGTLHADRSVLGAEAPTEPSPRRGIRR